MEKGLEVHPRNGDAPSTQQYCFWPLQLPSGSLCKWSDASPLIFSVTNTEFTWIRRSIQPSAALVVAGHCSTSGDNSGTIAPAVLLGRSEDSHYRGLDTLLPHHRLVSWQSKICVVVGADHHLFPQLSSH